MTHSEKNYTIALLAVFILLLILVSFQYRTVYQLKDYGYTLEQPETEPTLDEQVAIDFLEKNGFSITKD